MRCERAGTGDAAGECDEPAFSEQLPDESRRAGAERAATYVAGELQRLWPRAVESVKEDVLLSQDPEFWKLVEARRQQPTLSIADVRAKLGVAPKLARRPRRKTAARKPARR